MNAKQLKEAQKRSRLTEYVLDYTSNATREQLKSYAWQLAFTLFDNGLSYQDVDIDELIERLEIEED